MVSLAQDTSMTIVASAPAEIVANATGMMTLNDWTTAAIVVSKATRCGTIVSVVTGSLTVDSCMTVVACAKAATCVSRRAISNLMARRRTSAGFAVATAPAAHRRRRHRNQVERVQNAVSTSCQTATVCSANVCARTFNAPDKTRLPTLVSSVFFATPRRRSIAFTMIIVQSFVKLLSQTQPANQRPSPSRVMTVLVLMARVMTVLVRNGVRGSAFVL
mmetsp:Transcript_15672/g.26931  ORF Transcript_15672/g.26931 Transcript_15672/m.26931 type:complete len:218 (-) Transcript_15672:58-711(-)